MSDLAIRGEGLSKRYRIGQQERYLALRDILARSLKAPWGLLRANGSDSNHRPQHIWAAVKDVVLPSPQVIVIAVGVSAPGSA